MTTDPKPTESDDFDEDVTLAASDRAVQDIQSKARRGRREVSVWKTDDDVTSADPAVAGSDERSTDPGLADEPTVIRGFGDEPTTPLDDRVKSQIAGQQQPKPVEAEVTPTPAGPKSPRGPSLIDGVEPPGSDTSFFQLDEMVTESKLAVHTPARRSRFPVSLLVLALLLVVVTITVVLAVLLGTSAL